MECQPLGRLQVDPSEKRRQWGQRHLQQATFSPTANLGDFNIYPRASETDVEEPYPYMALGHGFTVFLIHIEEVIVQDRKAAEAGCSMMHWMCGLLA